MTCEGGPHVIITDKDML